MGEPQNEKIDRSATTAMLLSVLKLLIGIIVLLTILSFIFGRTVYPGMIGVRQITVQLPFGPEAGISKQSLEPGLHWNIPFYSKVHFIPQETQILHLHRKSSVDSGGLDQAVEVQTTDGSSVLVDVSILSHYYDKAGEVVIDGDKYIHGGPADLLKELGLSDFQWTNTIQKDAVDELKRALASLSTSEFYNPHLREKQIAKAKKKLNGKLAPFGIKIDDILLRRYSYSTQGRIDEAIFAKNLQEAEERLNKAASSLADVLATLERISAEMDAKIATLEVEGQNRAKVIRSEGNLYEAQKRAEGDLAVAKAIAEIDKLKANVLASTSGAEIYVAREMSPLVSSLSGGVVSNIDPYDIEAWMKRFGLAKGAE